ncbi:MAG: glycosyltransferase [Rhodospirillales bacterium]|jgi:alpha-maltose-1-phosphate synthase|nr:glycosyltransferase [Rhodospirillales bacterium]
MKLRPEKPANAVLFYHPDAVESGAPELMGRHAAGEGFLTGFVRYSDAKTFFCHCADKTHFADFSARIGALDPSARPRRWISLENAEKIGKIGCLSLPTPSLAGAAWRRRAGDTRAYSICGVNHTIASESVMDGLGELLTSPVQPWDAVVCTSRAVKATVRRLIVNQAEFLNARTGGNVQLGVQLPVIPLGVHCDAYAPGKQAHKARTDLRERYGIEEDDIAVLFMGRLSFHAKAHPLPMYLALEETAHRTGKNIHLIQAGWFANEGIEKEFRDGAKAFCPSVNPIFVDGRDETVRSKIWFAADIFCSLSDNIQETFGLTPIEAMAAGLPSVVSDWDGYRDTVRHGFDGFTIPTWMPPEGAGRGLELPVAGQLAQINRDQAYNLYCGNVSQATAIDVPACIEAFSVLVKDAGMRRKMGDAARARALGTFDWRVIVAAYQALWKELEAIRRSASEIAPLADGRPIHPLRDDPFALYSAYPTQSSTGKFAIGPVQGADKTRLKAIRRRGMNRFAASTLPPEPEIDALLERLNEGGVSALDDFVDKAPEEKRAGVLRGVGWLAKAGLARILPAAGDIARTDGGDEAKSSEDSGGGIAALRRAVMDFPASVGARKELARAYFAHGDRAHAVNEYFRAIRIAPDDAELWYWLGMVLRHDGDGAAALECFKKCKNLAGPQANLLCQQGMAFKTTGKRKAAKKAFKEALEVDPENVHAQAALASMEAARGHGKGYKRVALSMSKETHFDILRPLFDELADAHSVLISGDQRELIEFDPDTVVVCEAPSGDLQRAMPDAEFVQIDPKMAVERMVEFVSAIDTKGD